MSRFLRLTIVAIVTAPLVASDVLADGPKTPRKAPNRRVVVAQPAQGTFQVLPMQRGGSGLPALPGYYQLSNPDTQKELELLPEQIEKLKAIAEEYRKKQAELAKSNQGNWWKDWQKMTPEERKAKSTEYREKYAKLHKETAAEVEKVLLPHQIERLKELQFNARIGYFLRNPQALERVGISAEQKDKLDKIRDRLAEEYAKLQKKALDDALEVLTPEQLEKLKEQVQQRRW